MNIPQLSRSEILRQTTSTATRHGISATAHLALVADTLCAGGADMDNFVGSVSTVKRHRLAEREAAATTLRSSFHEKWNGYPKLLQWDGKQMDVLTEVTRREMLMLLC